MFLEIGAEQFPQLVRQKYDPPFALVADLRLAGLDGLGGDEAQLGHSNPCGADGLDHQGQSFIFFLFCRPHQTHILGAGQLLVLGEKVGFLDFEFPQP